VVIPLAEIVSVPEDAGTFEKVKPPVESVAVVEEYELACRTT